MQNEIRNWQPLPYFKNYRHFEIKKVYLFYAYVYRKALESSIIEGNTIKGSTSI